MDDKKQLTAASAARWMTIILFASGLLRLVLAFVNDEANDAHFQVVRLLLEHMRSLTVPDCTECFQPKLFYLICVALIRMLSISTHFFQYRFTELLCASAGIATLAVLARLSRREREPAALAVMAFAVFAFNADLLAINGQATNDSFVILFSTLAIWHFAKFFRSESRESWLIAVLFATCAGATKSTSWVVAVAALLTLIFRALSPGVTRERTGRFAVYGALLIAAVIASALVSVANFENSDRYASQGRGQPLYWSTRVVVGRAGVVSVLESFLTFRIVDLVEHPKITNSDAPNQRHRMSLWSQLYGRLHFAQFSDWPQHWQTDNPRVFRLGQLLMILGLVPSGLLLVGIGVNLRDAWLRPEADRIFFLLVVGGYLAFSVAFSYTWRGFEAMKALYLFPGVLAFFKVFMDGLRDALEQMRRYPKIRAALVANLAALVAAYIVDIGFVIHHLATRNWGQITAAFAGKTF